MTARRGARASAAARDAAPAAAASARNSTRIPAIDALRGLAVVAMVAYHFCFDLAWFKVTGWNFYRDPFWLHARTAILSSFLLLAGVSLVLAERAGSSPRHFWTHVGRIAGCALLVTAGSALLFPRSFIWFGVLHAIAVSLVLVRPLVRRPWLCLALGIVVILAGMLVAAPAFDASVLGWIGFATTRPSTEDYVPLFPWTGVLLVGMAAGHALVARGVRAAPSDSALVRALAFPGRHSLAVYMIHQPLLIPLAAGIAWVTGVR